jgi:hypothetical protein
MPGLGTGDVQVGTTTASTLPSHDCVPQTAPQAFARKSSVQGGIWLAFFGRESTFLIELIISFAFRARRSSLLGGCM